MSAKSRNKGAAGERELARLLTDELGVEVTRNLLQTREGGHDLNGVPGWCVEAKRRAKVTEGEKRQWFDQVLGAWAAQPEREWWPAVLYREDRKDWRALVPLHVLAPEVFPVFAAGTAGASPVVHEQIADISLPAFCQIVRESIEQTA